MYLKINSTIDHKSYEDESLVKLVQQGNLDAFTQIYERYLPSVYNRVRYRVPPQDVEDVTQDIFISVMRSIRGFRGESKFKTWLRTVTNRKIVDYYRSRKPARDPIDADINDVEGFQVMFKEGEIPRVLDDYVALRWALEDLPEKYREIILLRFADGLQFDEIADVIGKPLEATKSQFRRSIAALRTRMDQFNG